MSKAYRVYLESLVSSGTDAGKPIATYGFKCNQNYQEVLEHLSKDVGVMYLKKLEEEFPEISYDIIKAFVSKNDKYGSPTKAIFTMNTDNTQKLLYCSSTSLRYVYHAMKILRYLKETSLTKVVELGVGYGGLFLAINYFSNILDIHIEQYDMVDMPEVLALVTSYLELNRDSIHIPYSLYVVPGGYQETLDQISWTVFPENKSDLFFISNYCMSYITPPQREIYRRSILEKSVHGFLTWQTCFGVDEKQIENVLKKTVLNITDEVPQTGPDHAKNVYVIF